jgi:hypothetical protein
MNTTKALWDLEESKLVSYPRNDNEPVVGLDSRYVTVDMISDDIRPPYNSIEEQVVPTTVIDLDALTYTYTWTVEPLPPQPDYNNFYSALMVSKSYQTILSQVLSSTSSAPTNALVLFISTLRDCLSGRVNTSGVQNSIWLLLGQVTLDTVYLEELQTILANAHLDQVYSIIPPDAESQILNGVN